MGGLREKTVNNLEGKMKRKRLGQANPANNPSFYPLGDGSKGWFRWKVASSNRMSPK